MRVFFPSTGRKASEPSVGGTAARFSASRVGRKKSRRTRRTPDADDTRVSGSDVDSALSLPKLTLGAADDRAEAEADQIAERALKGLPPLASTSGSLPAPAVRRRCEACQEEEEQPVRRRAASGGGQSTAGAISHLAAPPIVSDVLRAPGRPLAQDVRAFMEPRFGHDFSRVRIHTDAHAARSARAIGALAYTVGPNVVFGEGRYAPGSAAGNELLAHELAHVVQQARSAGADAWVRRRVICPPGEDPARGVGCRSEAGSCADLLQMSAPPGTQGCWDEADVPQGPATPPASTTAAGGPAADFPFPSVFDDFQPSPSQDTDPLWPGCPGGCHERHPNMMAGRPWNCTASCNVEGTAPHCTGRVTGSASGPSEGAACRAAKRVATQSAPRGCYARHCQCSCSR